MHLTRDGHRPGGRMAAVQVTSSSFGLSKISVVAANATTSCMGLNGLLLK